MPKRTRDHQSWLLDKLSDPRRAASYLSSAFEDSPQMFLEALRDVAQVRQMAKVAKNAGVTRESLYKATSAIGNPTFETFVSVLTAMDLTFVVVAKDATTKPSIGSRARRRYGKGSAPRSPQLHSALSAQLDLAFPTEITNVVRAGSVVRSEQPSASAQSVPISWTGQVPPNDENSSLVFNAMLATMVKTSSIESARG
jgi:probable addiction module antidote protein